MEIPPAGESWFFECRPLLSPHLLGNRCSFQRVQKFTVCYLWLVDFASSPLPFLDHGTAAKILITHWDNTASYAGYHHSISTISMDAMMVKPVYLPLGSPKRIHKDPRLNSAFAKSSRSYSCKPLIKKSKIPYCSLTWIDCKIEAYKIA